jgi:hypothetical protein
MCRQSRKIYVIGGGRGVMYLANGIGQRTPDSIIVGDFQALFCVSWFIIS